MIEPGASVTLLGETLTTPEGRVVSIVDVTGFKSCVVTDVLVKRKSSFVLTLQKIRGK